MNNVKFGFMRLEYVDSTTAHPHSLEWWARNRQDPDSAIHLVRTWAWSPWAQEAQQRLGHALHERTPVPTHLKELAIVRVCSMVHSPYELFHHVPIARLAGLSTVQTDALRRSDAAALDIFNGSERAVIAYTDEFDAGRGVQPETFERLSAHLDPAGIIALSCQIGYWGCNARLTVAMGTETEGWIDYPAPAPSAETHVRQEPRDRSTTPTTTDGAGRLGVPVVESLGAKGREWLDRWTGKPTLLVRSWSWSEHLQATNQNMWAVLTSDQLAIDPLLRSIVAHRVSWLRHSPVLLELLADDPAWAALDDVRSAAIAGDHRARASLPAIEGDLLDFIDVWENGLGMGDSTFEPAHAALGPRGLVEAQIIAGFIGTQARLATALRLPLGS